MKSTKVQVAPRNNSIDLFRLFCAVLIVVIHTSPFEGTILGTVLRELAARIAVPYFLVVAGYFYYTKLERDGRAIKVYLKHIFAIYFLWSIPYWFLNLHVLHDEPGFSITGYVVRCITDFFTRGSYYHFWFFPAIIYSVIASTILLKFCNKAILFVISLVLMVLGCWHTSYSAISPLFHNLVLRLCGENGAYLAQRILFTGIPYFMLGAFL